MSDSPASAAPSSSAEPASADEKKPHAAVICNPVKADASRLRAAVDAAAAAAGWLPSAWFETTADDPGGLAVEQALAQSPAVLIVAGGDGTLRCVVEALDGRSIPVAIVPSGTGNLLARNLGLPIGHLEASVRAAFAQNERPIDVARAAFERADGTIDRHSFLVMAGVGLDARMAAHTNPELKRRIGWLAYTDPISRSIMSGDRFALRYALDGGRARSGRAHTMIVGNCGTLTAGLLLIPEARPDDGLLDSVTLRPRGVGGWLHIGVRLLLARFLHRTRTGRLVRDGLPDARALRFDQARRIDVRFEEPLEVQLDGDGFGSIIAASLTVRQHALTLRVPGGA